MTNANRIRGILSCGFVLAVAATFLPAAPADEPDRLKLEAEASSQAAEADRLFKAGEYAAALPLYEAERTSRAALGDVRYEAYATRAIGCCRGRLGDLEGAIASWKISRRLDARRNDPGFQGYDWLLIGQAELQLGRPEESAETLARALPLLSQAIDRDHEADARLYLARALTDLDQADRALGHLDRALELARALDDPQRLANILVELARLETARGQPGPAAEWMFEAREALLALGRTGDAAAMDRMLGDAFLDLGRPDIAVARVELAAEAHQQEDNSGALGDDLQFLAVQQAADGDLSAARDLARRAATAWSQADDPPREIEALVGLARFESQFNDWAAADKVLAHALPLIRQFSEPAERVRLLVLAHDVRRRARPAERSPALLDEARRIARESDDQGLDRLINEAEQRQR